MVVSHSDALLRELGVVADDDDDDAPVGLGSPARRLTLVKDLGESFVEGQGAAMHRMPVSTTAQTGA